MMQMLRVLKTELNQAALAASPSMPLAMARGGGQQLFSLPLLLQQLVTSLEVSLGVHLLALYQVPLIIEKILQAVFWPCWTTCIHAEGICL